MRPIEKEIDRCANKIEIGETRHAFRRDGPVEIFERKNNAISSRRKGKKVIARVSLETLNEFIQSHETMGKNYPTEKT